MKGKLMLDIVRPGQQYVDDPVMVRPKRQSVLSTSVRKAFDPEAKGPAPVIVGYTRTRLKWIKPTEER